MKNRRINRKGEEKSSIGTVMVIVMVLIVIGFILFFIFRSQILTYLSNLIPGYNYNATDKTVEISQSDLQSISRYCAPENKIGFVKVDGGNTYFYVNGVKTNLILLTNGVINLKVPFGGGIGTVGNDGTISIDPNYLAQKMEDKYPNDKFGLLNGAYLLKNTDICKISSQ